MLTPGPGSAGITPARIGLPRVGASIATASSLELRLAHARARDAVHEALEVVRLAADLGAAGQEVLQVESQAVDRQKLSHAPRSRPRAGAALGDDAATARARI